MPTTVIMKTSRPDGAGGTYKQGSTYTIADDLAAYFLSIGAAKRPRPLPRARGSRPPNHRFAGRSLPSG